MSLIEQTLKQISCYDNSVSSEAKKHLESLAMPHWALGNIMDLAMDLAGITGQLHPSFKKKVSLVMAADHGVASEGVSAYPQEVTKCIANAVLKNGAAINAIANSVNSKVVLVDAGMCSPLEVDESDAFFNKRIDNGTKNFVKGPAMSRDQAVESIESGIEIVECIADSTEILGLGEIGIANTTSATAILCGMVGIDPEVVTGRGTGIDDNSLKNKISTIKQALEINNPNKNDGIDLLQKVGGFEIGSMAGAILGAAAKRIPIIIDGLISTSAALIAYSISPKITDFIIASHVSKEPAHKLMLQKLGKKPYLDLEMRLGEGTGAALFMPIIDSASAILNKMFTLEEALLR